MPTIKVMVNTRLRAMLLAMAKADQNMRNNALQNGAEWDYSLDKEHAKKLREIVTRYGWPTISLVGIEASNDAWLIAQHSDHDLSFQKKCLALLKTLPAGEISSHNIAYLEDRILVAEHKAQLYGTQFQGSGVRLKPRPIKDKKHLNERRKCMGLEPFEEYEKTMLKMYGN